MSKNPKKNAQSLKIPGIIRFAAKLIALFSTRAAMRFCARLFTTPIRHKTPKREFEMDRNSRQQILHVPAINKDIVVYQIGDQAKKALLVHGWSGRGTQLVKFADALLAKGYSVISFDAPAHGKSPGKTTLLPEFVECIFEIEKHFGPFESAIGHSLGGMALLNATKKGLKIGRLVTIGSGDIIKDIFDDFVSRMELKPEISDLMRIHFESKHQQTMESYSSYLSAQQIDIPVLVIHDNDDAEVPVKCAVNIHRHLKNGQLILTKKLGHRKILGDPKVIEQSLEFINTNI